VSREQQGAITSTSTKSREIQLGLKLIWQAMLRERGEFRNDLYCRLNVFPVFLPPLRERREDIPALVQHFIEVFGRRMGRQIEHIPQETMSAFSSYEWPGNIRELQNLTERALILSKDGVLLNPLRKTERQGTFGPPTTLRDSERELILRTLEAVGWVIGGAAGAAAKLGLKRTTLINRMQKLEIFRPRLQSRQDVMLPTAKRLESVLNV
jgi:transcriptional regulator with GAF, ATPase, and Fis domain